MGTMKISNRVAKRNRNSSFQLHPSIGGGVTKHNMSKKSRAAPSKTSASTTECAEEKQLTQALAKYKELYTYSTDVLLKEHDRFTRSDDKATKYSGVFVFLLGTAAYFDKWIVEKFPWKDFPVGIPDEWPLYISGAIALILSALGWVLTILSITLKPVVSRPLNKDVLEFFEKESLLNIYYGIARENSKAYQANKMATDKKLARLARAHYVLIWTFGFTVLLLIMYCCYSWL